MINNVGESLCKRGLKKGRGTQLTAIEVLGDPCTNKRAHAVTWAFHLLSHAC